MYKLYRSDTKKVIILDAPMPIVIKKPASKPATPSDSTAASPSKASPKQTDLPVPHSLKVPRDLFERMEKVVAAQPVKQSRNAWILYAIHEKLERDEG
jgi:hypothetical protein